MTDFYEELHSLLNTRLKDISVVVMPDFFLDRLVSLDWNTTTLSRNIERVARRKGGSIDGIAQTELKGGNAVNTASALAALGVNVIPIVCTDKMGFELLEFYLKPFRIDLSHVKILKKASITTAIELGTENGKANIMLRDAGSLADFGPEDLNDSDLEAIEDADYVCVFNWAGTRKHGTELAETVFSNVKKNGKGKTYYDTADPSPNWQEASGLIRKVLQTKLVDILSLNEHEANFYASQLGIRKKTEDTARESARALASKLPARIDLHTTEFSATFTGKSETEVSAFSVQALRVTGAGDAWNAGNILGDACGLADASRLTLANAVAAYYVSEPTGNHPTRKQIAEFLKKRKGKKT